MKDTFLIVDGNSLMHRAFHALPLMDADGVYTNAIYGFFSMLFRVIGTENVRWLAICFDEHGPTFRHTVYPDYKAGRAATPEELKQQFETIRGLLTEMGIQWYTLAGWEADDLLGTLSLYGNKENIRSLLLTGDRDALQLIGNGTELMFTKKGISEAILFDPPTIYETFGFRADQVTDWKGLAGDSSDNIPGVPGVGDKTAVKLLQEYQTLENVLDHADEVKGKLGEKLRTYRVQALFCKQLATIRRDAPVTFSLGQCVLPSPDGMIEPLKKLKLFSLIKRLREQFGAEENREPAAGGTEATVYRDPTEATETGTILAWLSGVKEEDRPLAYHVTDTRMTVAAGNGEWLVISLGGDLLTPGLDMEEVFTAVREDLSGHPAVVHDSKRWMKMLDRSCGQVPERFGWDTMIAAYLINALAKSYALDTLTDRPDARGVRDLYLAQRRTVGQQGLTALMNDIEMPLAAVLYQMEKTGFRIDTALLRTMGDGFAKEIEELRKSVIDACGVGPFNLNSPQQLGEVLFEKLGLPHGKKTSKGYSTSVEVLEGLTDIAPEIVGPLLRYRQMTKLNGTYVESLIPMADKRGRIHSYFDQVSTATGRISSLEPNLQNIPVRTAEGRKIREAFVPEEGWILLDADYSQIELRLMAHYSGDSSLVNAFREGKDIHTQTASEIFDIPADQVTGEIRSRAKAVNFGLIYGISGFGLSRNTGVSRKEAEDFIARYFAKYPGVKRFMDSAVSEGTEKGYTMTLMGRRRELPELKSDKAQIREFGKRVAMNTPIQGTAADIIKLAMVKVHERLKEEGMRSRLILQVHDELLLECPPEEIEKARSILSEVMENVYALKVPLIADINEGRNWAEAK